MRFFNFYKRKLDFALRIKFITFKFFYINYFLKNFVFEFKGASGVSAGSFIFLYNFLLRFSTLQVDQLFKNVRTLLTHRQLRPRFKTAFSLRKWRGSKKKIKIFKFLFFFFSSRVSAVVEKVRDNFDNESLLSTNLLFKSVQQTFLGFSSHILGGTKFSEAYHSFFWNVSSDFCFVNTGVRQLEKGLLSPNSLKAVGVPTNKMYSLPSNGLDKSKYSSAMKTKVFNKHKVLTRFIFSSLFNRLIF